MYDPTKAKLINDSANQILDRLGEDARDPKVKAVLPKESDLVLEIVPLPTGGVVVGYYFADHSSKLLFWMDDFDAERICDTLTSMTSTALWTAEHNQSLLAVLNHVKVENESDRIWAGAIIGRVMRNTKHTQFVHLYGEYGARLDWDQSIHGMSVHPRSWYLKVIEPFLFWGVEAHLVALEKIWVDRAAHISAWRMYIEDLGSQWRDLIIAATVLLNVNIAVLSIQSVDNNGVATQHRSPTQILIYVSAVTSLSSMLFALLLATFLERMTNRNTGLESLAIMYTLPYALLMWS
ncbi:hypothetical protein HWV62_24894 [Athelia sp. TMB]|nr:hypothetical protein HWV62_24894 [Athelia sp. TMB]